MNEFSILALGGNRPSEFGSPRKTLMHAIGVLEAYGLPVENTSKFYGTPAFPKGSGPDYVNGAVLVKTNHAPQKLLDILHQIEAEMGRKRQARWDSRAIDIDLIACGNLVSPDASTQETWRNLSLADQKTLWPDQLILPHPRLQDRAFVLVPACDVAPGWVHPLLGLSMKEMLENLPESDRKEVVEL